MANVEIKDKKKERCVAYFIEDWVKGKIDNKIIPSLGQKDKDYLICIDGEERSGKCQPTGSKVLMANGEFKNIEDIKIGDKVISPQKDGTTKFSCVLNTTNWFCDDVYNIISINKKKKLYSCSGNHIIPLNYKQKGIGWVTKQVTPKDILNNSKKDFKRNNLSLICPPIKEFNGRENCIVEPYTLGALLGNGCLDVGNHALDITCGDEEIIKEIEKTYVIMSIKHKKDCNAKCYRFSKYNYYTKIKALSLFEELKSVELLGKKSGDKFIPKEALYSDINYRKRLLAGLIDTDGYRCSKSGYEITTKSKQLAEDMQFLVYSLGGRCSGIKECIKGIKRLNFQGKYFRIGFNFPDDIEIPCKVFRKKRKTSSSSIKKVRNGVHVIRSEKTKSCQVYGFELEGDSHWYITDNFQVTHNSTLAFQLGRYIDPTLDLSRVVFSAEEFKKAIFKAKKGQVIIFDEAFTGLSSRASLSSINKYLISLMMQMGQNNLCVILVLPTFFLLDKYAAIFRSKILFHVYENKNRRGYYRVYNKRKKKQLWFEGKKDYSYKVKTKNRGHFYGKFALGDETVEEDYRKSKMKALEETEKNPMNTQGVKYMEQRNLLLHILKKYTKLSFRKMEKLLDDYDFSMTYAQIRLICNKYGDVETEEDKKEIKKRVNEGVKEEIDDESIEDDEESDDLKAFDDKSSDNELENDEIDADSQ